VRSARAAVLGGIGFASAVLLAAPPASAGEDRRWHASVYASQWLETDLADIPQRIATSELASREAYFVGGALAYVLLQDLGAVVPVGEDLLSGSKLELEAELLQHFGEQDHVEGTVALLLRSPTIDLPGGARVNFAFGEGLSYAFSEPDFEGHGRVEASQFLNYLAFEAELGHEAIPNLHIVPRLHHRSGVFGLIAPKYSGSNYFGVGLRLDLQ